LVAQKIAQIKDVSYAEVCEITSENAIKLFNLAI
jgi:Tat protein secretion system quality control protein TatD with DNase activity